MGERAGVEQRGEDDVAHAFDDNNDVQLKS